MKINDLFLPDSTMLNWDVVDGLDCIKALKGCAQSEKWHKEGDVYEHTKMCIDATYNKLMNQINAECSPMETKCVIASVLLHDIGKAVTTNFIKGDIHSYGHEFESERMTRLLLWDEVIIWREMVCGLVRNHMLPLQIMDHKNSLTKIAALSMNRFFTLEQLYFVKAADIYGTINDDSTNDYVKLRYFCYFYNRMNCYKEPFVDTANVTPHTRKFLLRKPLFGEDYHKGEPVIEIIMMIGLPGSGKSTKVKEVIDGKKAACESEPVVISRDIVRAELGFCEQGEKCVLDKEKENLVSRTCDEKLVVAIKEGKNVILDNMHTKLKYRNSVKMLLKQNFPKYNFVFRYIYCETSLKNNLERRPMISKEIYDGMIYSIDWPTPDEYHDIYIRLT